MSLPPSQAYEGDGVGGGEHPFDGKGGNRNFFYFYCGAAMDTIKVGIIGAGGIAQASHIPSFQKVEGVEIVAIADINETKAMETAQKFGIPKVFKDYKDLLGIEEIDAVSICTPNVFHKPISIEALNAGKDVICEKPVAAKGADAEEIIAAAKENGKIFMAAQVQRFSPVSQVLKRFIERGDFGEIYYVKGGYIRRRGIPGLGGWFTNKALALGGCMMDIGVHALDRMYWLIGAPKPVSVSGMVVQKFKDNAVDGGWPPLHTRRGDVFTGVNDVDDMASGYVKFDNGAVLLVEASWAGNCEPYSYLELMGTKAGAKTTGSDLKIFSEMNDNLVDIAPVLPQRVDPFLEEMKHFIECVRTRKEPITTPEEIINVARILEAVYKSAATGREVLISEL